MRDVIATKDGPQAIGPYSQAIRVNGFVFCAGQTPIDPAVGKLIEGDVPDYPGGVSPTACILPGITFSGGMVPGGLIERMKAMIFHRWSAVLMV